MKLRQLISKNDWRRWLGWLILVIVFSVACVSLSNWQFNRRAEALSKIEQITKNYDAPAVGIDGVATESKFDARNEWRPVKLNGHYLPSNAVLVRNRPLDGNPGFLQLVPFQLMDGRLVAIERGWLPTDDKYSAPKNVPLPSDQDQTVIARIRPAEPTLDRSAPVGQLGTINVESLVKSQHIKDKIFTTIYLRMATESIPAAANPKQLAKPQLDEGNHLSYALQWIMFALMAISALIWGIKKEREAQGGKSLTKRKRVGDADAEAEDNYFPIIN